MSDLEGRESPEMYLKTIYLMILLTEKGRERAEIVSEKFRFWVDFLEKLGVDPDMAQVEACKFEHAISDEAFLKIKTKALPS